MPADTPDTPAPQPSGKDRRAYFRINVVLPICIQLEADTTEGAFTEQSVNLSGGGIGVVVHTVYQPNEILSLTLHLPNHVVFKTYMEVLRLDPLPYRAGTHRLHARFIKMTTQNQELLIRYIMHFQREHLQGHYSA
ncbi:MAG: PilZ domain-containing protein [Nitrospira sp.]